MKKILFVLALVFMGCGGEGEVVDVSKYISSYSLVYVGDSCSYYADVPQMVKLYCTGCNIQDDFPEFAEGSTIEIYSMDEALISEGKVESEDINFEVYGLTCVGVVRKTADLKVDYFESDCVTPENEVCRLIYSN